MLSILICQSAQIQTQGEESYLIRTIIKFYSKSAIHALFKIQDLVNQIIQATFQFTVFTRERKLCGCVCLVC